MSLLGSIFGGATEKGGKEKEGGLFKAASLPAPPQHTVFPPRRKRQEPTSEDVKNIPTEAAAEAPGRELKKRKRHQNSKDETTVKDSEKESDTPTSQPDVSATDQGDQPTDKDAEERTIFVGNLPLDTTRRSLASLFKSCGKVESTRLRSVAAAGIKLPPERAGDQNLMKKVCANTKKVDSEAKTTAQGYVVFAAAESVEKALELNNTLVQSKRIRVDHATPTMDASRSVFVGNLPYLANEESLKAHFENLCGEATVVEGARIVRDKDTMQCKGFGYVLFQDKAMVATALQKVPDSVYLKRKLRVQVCGKRTKNKRGKNDIKIKKRSFEGNRATITSRQGGTKNSNHRRARGEKKNSANVLQKNPGVSKRAAAQAKEGKRVKQIEKRIAKGMGKTRR